MEAIGSIVNSRDLLGETMNHGLRVVVLVPRDRGVHQDIRTMARARLFRYDALVRRPIACEVVVSLGPQLALNFDVESCSPKCTVISISTKLLFAIGTLLFVSVALYVCSSPLLIFN